MSMRACTAPDPISSYRTINALSGWIEPGCFGALAFGQLALAQHQAHSRPHAMYLGAGQSARSMGERRRRDLAL
jgi:hypothetical protein